MCLTRFALLKSVGAYGQAMKGIRLDSGDLKHHRRLQMLDDEPYGCVIVASTMQTSLRLFAGGSGACDSFGVVTFDHPNPSGFQRSL